VPSFTSSPAAVFITVEQQMNVKGQFKFGMTATETTKFFRQLMGM